ncbi:MAG: hypothetical protein U1D97_08885 [Desulfuromonadales bacterium]|nr:hypothetical protein [Desulfuromonadales bacterium]
MIFFKLSVVVVGLILPGMLLARTFRVEHVWSAAFPLSALILVESIILFSLIGIPLHLSTMSGALIVSALICQRIISLRRSATPLVPPPTESSNPTSNLVAVTLVFICSLLIAVMLRTTLFPLRGPDTSFRWEGLALAMLQHQSLDFYPPVSAGDYAIYLYPDGIPPLIATVYWWIYAAIGHSLPQATSISVVLQLAATMALTFYGTRHAFGRQAAWYALLVIGTSPLLVAGFAIGQETGFTALSVAGQLCFAWAAVRNPKRSTVIVAALFAVMGALTRDYGPALALAGSSVLLWHRETRRFLPTYILTVTLLAAPWYLRSWVLTGNPFFSHPIPGFNVNAIHAAVMDHYQQVYAFGTFSLQRWLILIKQLVTGGFLAIGIGLPYALIRWREFAPLLITALLVTLLWVYSVGQTAGGVVYSTRVLTPAIVALSIAAGVALSRWGDARREGEVRGFLAYGTRVLLILLIGYSFVSLAIYPSRSQSFFTVPTGAASGSIQQVVVDHLEAVNLPATGVLTDMTFLAEIMKRTSRFRPVMHWNPEIEFVFDLNLDSKEIHRRLVENNIKLILVDYKSPNNQLLSNYKFFRESSEWELLFMIENEFAVYFH